MKRPYLLLPLGLPALAGALWLASGREIFTKGAKPIAVEYPNEKFGGVDQRVEFVPGPILGHYIGLDSVIGAALLAGLCSGLLLLVPTPRPEPLTREKQP